MRRFWKKEKKTDSDATGQTTAGEGSNGASESSGDDSSAANQYPTDPRKARSWFERAKAVSDSGQYDYAIQCYLFGLRFEPDALDHHEALLEVALKRKVGGGGLNNSGIHFFDTMRFLLGDIRTVAAAQNLTREDMQGEDTSVVVLTFQSGAIGSRRPFHSPRTSM